MCDVAMEIPVSVSALLETVRLQVSSWKRARGLVVVVDRAARVVHHVVGVIIPPRQTHPSG